jgi:hypothetical protein
MASRWVRGRAERARQKDVLDVALGLVRDVSPVLTETEPRAQPKAPFVPGLHDRPERPGGFAVAGDLGVLGAIGAIGALGVLGGLGGLGGDGVEHRPDDRGAASPPDDGGVQADSDVEDPCFSLEARTRASAPVQTNPRKVPPSSTMARYPFDEEIGSSSVPS